MGGTALVRGNVGLQRGNFFVIRECSAPERRLGRLFSFAYAEDGGQHDRGASQGPFGRTGMVAGAAFGADDAEQGQRLPEERPRSSPGARRHGTPPATLLRE